MDFLTLVIALVVWLLLGVFVAHVSRGLWK